MSKLLGGTRVPSYPFENIGDGFDALPIVETRDVQQYRDGLPLFWPARTSASRAPVTYATDPATGESLDPVMQLKIVVATGVTDPAIPYDDGMRAVYLAKHALAELRADLKRTGSRSLDPGGRLSMRFTAEEKVDQRTGKRLGIPKKLWKISYEPPARSTEPEDGPPAAAAPAASVSEVPAGVDPEAYRAALATLRRQASVTGVKDDDADVPF